MRRIRGLISASSYFASPARPRRALLPSPAVVAEQDLDFEVATALARSVARQVGVQHYLHYKQYGNGNKPTIVKRTFWQVAPVHPPLNRAGLRAATISREIVDPSATAAKHFVDSSTASLADSLAYSTLCSQIRDCHVPASTVCHAASTSTSRARKSVSVGVRPVPTWTHQSLRSNICFGTLPLAVW